MSKRDDWELIENGAYADAVIGFSDEIQARKSAWAFNNRGMAHLHLADYDAALADFRSAEALSGTELQTVCDGHMSGVALWMAAREKEAVDTWLAGVEASIAGLVRYGDAAGGVTVGNLLFFAGARRDDKSAIASASRLLRKRLRTKWSAAWPGPTSQYLLGRICESDMLAAVSDVSILRERELCQARFYSGVQALSRGEPAAYFDAMRDSCNLGRVSKLEAEYYLALHEVSSPNRAETVDALDLSVVPGAS